MNFLIVFEFFPTKFCFFDFLFLVVVVFSLVFFWVKKFSFFDFFVLFFFLVYSGRVPSEAFFLSLFFFWEMFFVFSLCFRKMFVHFSFF